MTRFIPTTAVAIAALAAAALAGCTSLESMMSSDKLDYKTATPAKTTGIEVPPDLTQLSRDSRYQQTAGGTVSAAAIQSAAAASAPIPVSVDERVATRTVGAMSIERLGNDRWLHTNLTPEQLWPQLQAFWKERGFVIARDDAASGVMETDWAENRAKLPLDFVRATIGRVFDNAFSTGEMDKFRTRLERAGDGGTDVYITHRGMMEVYTTAQKDNTAWQPRPIDPQLEGEFLSRLMLKLGATDIAAKAALATQTASTASTPNAPGAPARARLLTDRPGAALQIDDGFDRAWRRVGVALDRSGFTVEDRDRTQGMYFVRYIDPQFAGKEEPNFFAKLFSFGKKDDAGSPERYRVVVKADNDTSSTVSVLDGKGVPDKGDTGKRITSLLLDELK